MPKGKAKKDHPDLYAEVSQVGVSAAPKSVAHRRGGKHRVKEKDLTNSKYDDYDYGALVRESKERNLYTKDDKKVDMARKLRDDDMRKARAEREAVNERQRRIEEKKKAERIQLKKKFAAESARKQRRLEKESARDRGEDVSSDEYSSDDLEQLHDRLAGEDEYTKAVPVGHISSDESWESTATESTVRSPELPTVPQYNLRLFEWRYEQMPAPEPLIPANGSKELQLPQQVFYAPLKLVTIMTKDKVVLPGRHYPLNYPPDHVPVFPQHEREAARNGVCSGKLEDYVIEKGTDWAKRTWIQGWTAIMYFSSPARNSTRPLDQVHRDWDLIQQKCMRVKDARNDPKNERQTRHAQRRRNKVLRQIDVYESLSYRTLMGYLPAYLDVDEAGTDYYDAEIDHRLENLYYIRNKNSDVPSHYFWRRSGDWKDPTTPNPEWSAALPRPGGKSDGSAEVRGAGRILRQRRQRIADGGLYRLKRSPVSPSSILDQSSDPVVIKISQVEQELYENGLAVTLSQYRKKWLGAGQEMTWQRFGQALPSLYPSGHIPEVPPVTPQNDLSVASKIARYDLDGQAAMLNPYSGIEPWTRDDDALWSVEEDVELVEILSSDKRKGKEALYRGSSESPTAWLQSVSPSYKLSLSEEALQFAGQDPYEAEDRKVWEAMYLGGSTSKRKGTSTTCPFCAVAWTTWTDEAQTHHMYTHSAQVDPPRVNRRTRKSGHTDTIRFQHSNGNRSLNITHISRRYRRQRRPRAHPQANYADSIYSPGSEDPPDPYLPRVRRYPPYHPKAAWKPRSYSVTTIDSLEFLDEYVKPSRKMRRVNIGSTRRNAKGQSVRPALKPPTSTKTKAPRPQQSINPAPRPKKMPTKRKTTTELAGPSRLPFLNLNLTSDERIKPTQIATEPRKRRRITRSRLQSS